MGSIIIYTPHQILDQTKDDDETMDGHAGKPKGRGNSGDLGIDEKNKIYLQ
jgi:hypothetical protein